MKVTDYLRLLVVSNNCLTKNKIKKFSFCINYKIFCKIYIFCLLYIHIYIIYNVRFTFYNIKHSKYYLI